MSSSSCFDHTRSVFHKIENKARPFLYSNWYILLICATVFIAWVTECAPFGFAALILISSAVLMLSDDILPLTVNIFAAALMIFSSDVSSYLYLWPLFVVIGISILIFAIRNFKRPIFKGKMLFPMIAVSISLLISGANVTTSAEFMRALPMSLFLGIGVTAVYMLYTVYLKRDNTTDIPRYFANTLVFIGLTVAAELIVVISRADLPLDQWNMSYWDIGWGNRNNIATYFLLLAPMSFYMASRGKHILFYNLSALIMYICLILTFSRGGILFGAIGGVLALIFSVVKSPCKKKQLALLLSIIGVALIVYFCLFNRVNTIFESLAKRGYGLSGRDVLWAEAVEMFKQNPWLGRGFGYYGTGPHPVSPIGMYWFHSTFYEIIGKLGVFGIIAYAWYYLARFIILFKNIGHKFNLFVLAAWISFEGYSIMDTGTFVPYPYMMLVIVTIAVLELIGNTKKFEDIKLSSDNEFVADFNYDEAA